MLGLSRVTGAITNTPKPIRFSGHAKQQLHFRGTNEQEVADAIRNADWQPAVASCSVAGISRLM